MNLWTTHIGLVTLASVLWFSVQGQNLPEFHFAEELQISVNNSTLSNPFTGGLEVPQLQSFNLNDDDLPDLLVFDRVGNILLPFIAEIINGTISYTYQPAWADFFPSLNQLLIIKDLNCDGLDDLVSTKIINSISNVQLVGYLQIQTAEETIAFEETPFVSTDLLEGNITIHAFDIPAFEDINDDGDIDFLYIPIGGSTIKYYENQAVESGQCDLISFELVEPCWGQATYFLDGNFDLNTCSDGFTGGEGCAGSAMWLNDFDHDGDKDLYFSGRYDRHVLQLTNGGIPDTAHLISQTEEWIANGEELVEFPAVFPLSAPELMPEQLVIASNFLTGGGAGAVENYISLFQKNELDNDWDLVSDNFLSNTTIDHGFRSSPCFWDIDGDGLLDLFLAYNVPHIVFGYTSAIAWYKNTGTATMPAFELMDEDFGQLFGENLKAIHLAFGDINGDGTTEMVTGLQNGKIWAWQPVDTPLGPYQIMFPNPFDETTTSGFAKPQLIDTNQDGLLDLICGTKSGVTKFWQNIGTATLPVFELLNDTLGGVFPSNYFQENSPFLWPKEDGFWFFDGQFDGQLALHEIENIEATAAPVEEFQYLDIGERASINIADINNDNQPDLAIGNMRGGIQIYLSETGPTNTHFLENSAAVKIQVFPNPITANIVTVKLSEFVPILQWFLMDFTGREILSDNIQLHRKTFEIVLPNHLPNGPYFIGLRHQTGMLFSSPVIKI